VDSVIPLAHAEEYFLSYQVFLQIFFFLESTVLGGSVEMNQCLTHATVQPLLESRYSLFITCLCIYIRTCLLCVYTSEVTV